MTLRGLDSRESGQLYLDGWVLTYNLFREHESIGGKPPAEKAKVKAPFKTWADVVEQFGPWRVVPKVVPVEKPAGKVPRSPSRSKRLPATADLHQ